MGFTHFRFTSERIGNMITLIALNNFLGFVGLTSIVWYHRRADEHNVSLFGVCDTAGLWLVGVYICVFGGIVCSAVGFALHWAESLLADYIGSSWVAACIAKQLKWSLNIATINCSGWALIWGYQIKGMCDYDLGVAFILLIENTFFAGICVLLLVYLPCASSESGDGIWNAYGLFGSNDDAVEDSDEEKKGGGGGIFGGMFGGGEEEEEEKEEGADAGHASEGKPADDDYASESDGKEPAKAGWW